MSSQYRKNVSLLHLLCAITLWLLFECNLSFAEQTSTPTALVPTSGNDMLEDRRDLIEKETQHTFTSHDSGETSDQSVPFPSNMQMSNDYSTGTESLNSQPSAEEHASNLAKTDQSNDDIENDNAQDPDSAATSPSSMDVESEPSPESSSNSSDVRSEPTFHPLDKLLQKAEWLLAQNDASMTKKAVHMFHEAHDAGNSTATATLASLYLTAPDGVSRDIELAVSLLKNATENGNSDAQALLGFLHASGLAVPDVPFDKGAALLLWTVAAKGGSDIASMALAFRHFFGLDLEEDCSKAAEYYSQAAKAVFWETLNVFHPPSSFPSDETEMRIPSEILPPEPFKISFGEHSYFAESEMRYGISKLREIFEYNQHAADQGDHKAQLLMGTLSYYGEMDFPQNFDVAREYFLSASNLGRTIAHAYVGYIDLIKGDYESAVKYMSKAAELNDRHGMNGMGYVTLRGIGVERDAEKAADYFRSAAKLDHPVAKYNLAMLYHYGVGVVQSDNIAYELLMEASRDNHLQSSYMLGLMLVQGTSPAEKSCQKANVFLKKVAEQGMWNKLLYRALRAYERGNYRDALIRYLLAGHCGLDVGQFNSAFLYEHGLVANGYFREGWPFGASAWSKWTDASSPHGESGRERQVDSALDMYHFSAFQGTIHAMVRLGDLAFAEKRDYKRAAAAYEKAVKGRNAEAMFNLGWMHMRGFGMKPDKHMAKRYFDQAILSAQDAYIPASIALFILRTSDRILQWCQSASEWFNNWGSFPRSRESHSDTIANSNGDTVSRPSRGDSQEGAQSDFEKARSQRSDQVSAVLEVVITPDVIAVTVLLGLLIFVVNARQRRLLQAGQVTDNAHVPNDNEAGQIPA